MMVDRDRRISPFHSFGIGWSVDAVDVGDDDESSFVDVFSDDIVPLFVDAL